MARIVEYTVECPTCKVAGIAAMLGFDPEKGISCEAGHQFEQLPGNFPSPESEPKTDSVEEKTQSEPGEPAADQVRFSDVVKERKESAYQNEPPAAQQTEGELPISALKEARLAISAEIRGIVSGVSAAVNIKPDALVGVGGRYLLPGGDTLFGLRISEQWYEAIRQEAENRGQSFAEYMQDFINNVALQYEWSDAGVK